MKRGGTPIPYLGRRRNIYRYISKLSPLQWDWVFADYDQQLFRHPVYWSGFVLIGDPG